MALPFFGKKKPAPAPAAPKKSVPVVDADDFFKDMGRKPKKPTDLQMIDLPEITGLRERPLEPPGSTIKNAVEVSTDGLADKTLEVTPGLGNVKGISSDTIDTTVIPKEERIDTGRARTADDFFRNMGRKAAVTESLEVPEVTGLRERPEEHADTLGGVALTATVEEEVDELPDKNIRRTDIVYGDIGGVDVSAIDLSSLRGDEDYSQITYVDDQE